jgi:hypothetical protein
LRENKTDPLNLAPLPPLLPQTKQEPVSPTPELGYYSKTYQNDISKLSDYAKEVGINYYLRRKESQWSKKTGGQILPAPKMFFIQPLTLLCNIFIFALTICPILIHFTGL